MPTPLDDLFERLAALPAVAVSPSMFAERPACWVNGKEIAHLAGDGLDLRLTRAEIAARRKELRADPRVTLRRAGADWLLLRVATPADVGWALGLGERAVAAHLPAEGDPLRPPPTGRDLERRRKFH